MLALEEVGSSLTRVKKWGDGLVGGATMHTTALYLKTNSFTNSIMHFIGSSTKQHKKERKKSVSFEPRGRFSGYAAEGPKNWDMEVRKSDLLCGGGRSGMENFGFWV